MSHPYPPAPAGPDQGLPPAYAMPPAIVPRTNLLAVTAFVLGMLGLSLPALILGIVGRRQIDRSNGVEQGRWMATTGLILGIVFTALDSLFILFILIAVVTTPGY